MIKYITSGITVLILTSAIAIAGVSDIANFDFTPYNKGWQYRPLSDFKKLSSFNTISDFEKYYEKYIDKCINDTMVGSGSIPCNIGSDMWDRELNIVYKKLNKKLNKSRKKALKASQRLWVKERDLSLEAISTDKRQGSMYRLFNAQHRDEVKAMLTKQRTLFLKTIF